MPSPNPTTRREHAGSAVPTTLATSMSSIDTSFQIASGTGWPTGAVGPFFVVIDPGTGAEEKILCSSRTSTVVAVAASGRGADSTAAATHSSGATCYPIWAATEADELNAHAAASTDVHGITGALASAASLTAGLAGKQATGNYVTSLTGDVTAAGPGAAAATLAAVTTAQTVGDAAHVAAVTTDAKGRVTGMTSTAIIIPEASVTNLVTDLAAKQPLDADLTALAALAATVGLLVRTGANTFAVRTLGSSDGSIAIANGSGSAAPDFTLADTGVVTAGIAAASANWTLLSGSYRIMGGAMCFLHLQLQRNASTITGGSDGNITDVPLATIPAACRPNRDLRCAYAQGGQGFGTAAVQSSGAVQLETLHANATIALGDQVSIDFSYNLTS